MSTGVLENVAGFLSRYIPFPAKTGMGTSAAHSAISSSALNAQQPVFTFDTAAIRIAGLSGSLAVVIGAYGAHGHFLVFLFSPSKRIYPFAVQKLAVSCVW
ncbi:hypothetical protein Tcan_00478, partial [Toxocara canis]